MLLTEEHRHGYIAKPPSKRKKAHTKVAGA